jgi:hypothetical protein
MCMRTTACRHVSECAAEGNKPLCRARLRPRVPLAREQFLVRLGQGCISRRSTSEQLSRLEIHLLMKQLFASVSPGVSLEGVVLRTSKSTSGPPASIRLFARVSPGVPLEVAVS